MACPVLDALARPPHTSARRLRPVGVRGGVRQVHGCKDLASLLLSAAGEAGAGKGAAVGTPRRFRALPTSLLRPTAAEMATPRVHRPIMVPLSHP